MDTLRLFGRKIGVLLLVQMALGLMLPFIFLRPPFVNFPDYMTTFAESPARVRAGVFIGLVGSSLTMALGVAMWPVLSRYSQRLAVAFVAACAMSCTLDVVQDTAVMSMLSLSERFVSANGGDAAMYQIAGAAVASARRWAHYTQLIGFAAWIFTFYFSMLRTRLLPLPLAAFGLLGVISQFIGVTLLAFLGYGQQPLLAFVLAIAHVTAGVWLIVKGFSVQDDGTRSAPAT